MSPDNGLAQTVRLWSEGRPLAERMVLLILTTAAGTAVGYLLTTRLWLVALAAMVAVPGFLLLHRHPLIGIVIWMLAMPFLVDGAGGGLRRVFWLVHRALPVVTLLIVVVATRLGMRNRPLPRLGWAELAMAGYLVISALSIAYLSEVDRAAYILYDLVFIPMILYLLVRLLDPDLNDLKQFVPVVLFIVASQTIIGWLSWIAPQALPDAWLGRAGSRTTGSLQQYTVFGTTMVFAGVVLVHLYWNIRRGPVRMGALAASLLAALMLFMTFSRGSWLAGILVVLGLGLAYRGFLLRALVAGSVVVGLLIALGSFGTYLGYADQRLLSEGSAQSALSRLPVVIASVKMFRESPMTGVGYGNFEVFDRQYQEAILGLVVADRDTSSHNLYLTLLAEQGLPGLILYLAPAAYWGMLALRAARRLPRTGIWSRQLLVGLWLVLLSHVVVNNFSVMRVSFGLGMWWLTLALIAVVTTRALEDRGATETPMGDADRPAEHATP